MKKIITFSIVFIILITSLTNCTPNSGTGNNPSPANNTGDAGGDQGENSDNKLLIALQTNSFITDYDNNYFTKYLEEKLNMDIEFYQLPSSTEEVQTKLSLMVTSNSDLPDILIASNALSPETILEYGNNGIFLELNDYTQDKAKMPNYNAIPQADRSIMDDTQTMANGKMYSLSKYEPETWNLTPNRTFINRAWLDKLALSMPQTTEELKTVLKAFYEKDPNGNGIQDEIPVYGYQAGGYGQNIIASLMNAFEFWNGGNTNGGLALSEDGSRVIAPFTTDKFKNGLIYMHELYNENLLSPQIFTDEDTQFKATLNNADNVVGLTSFGSLSNYPDAANNKNYLEMELIKPFIGPDGTSYTPYTAYSPSQEFFIFSNCRNIDLAIKLADEFYNPETSIIARFGQEEVDWTRDQDKLLTMNNAYVAAGLYDQVTLAYISNYWLEPSAQTWHNVSPRYASLEMMNTVANGTKPYDPEDKTQLVAKSYDLYYDKHPDQVLALLHYNEEEIPQIQEALANIPIYVNQSIAEFITGARDIEGDWDNYINEMKSMGLEKWLEISQAAYLRGK